MYAKLTRLACLVLAFSILGACAPMEATGESAMKMDEAMRIARQALDAAKSAGQRADNALSVASDAAYEAGQAKSAAEAAQTCCNENRDRIERTFQTRMRK